METPSTISIGHVIAVAAIIATLCIAVIGSYIKLIKDIGKVSGDVDVNHAEIKGTIVTISTLVENLDGRVNRFIDYHEKNCPDRDGTLEKMTDTLTEIQVAVARIEKNHQ